MDSVLQYLTYPLLMMALHKENIVAMTPSYLEYTPTEFNRVSDELVKEGITHLSMDWVEYGKSVNVKLYSAPALGAVFSHEMKLEKELVINV